MGRGGGGEVVGCTLALMREGVWGLSLLVVHPSAQSSGIGRELLARAYEYGVRPGSRDDLPLTEEVDRAVRGAAHGDDLLALLETGGDLLVLPERGYAVVRDGAIRQLAAFDDDGAATLLHACLAAAGPREASAEWITSAQQWAVAPCLEAGLELRADNGAVFLAGDVGPFAPYLPSGAYL